MRSFCVDVLYGTIWIVVALAIVISLAALVRTVRKK